VGEGHARRIDLAVVASVTDDRGAVVTTLRSTGWLALLSGLEHAVTAADHRRPGLAGGRGRQGRTARRLGVARRLAGGGGGGCSRRRVAVGAESSVYDRSHAPRAKSVLAVAKAGDSRAVHSAVRCGGVRAALSIAGASDSATG